MKVLVVIPVFNEEAQVASSVSALLGFLKANCPFEARIVIADNGSVDRTLAIAHSLAECNSELRVVHLGFKGRGRALKKVWIESDADILSYMDVDLSTDLGSFPSMIGALASGRFDLAVGSRLLRASVTTRGPKRELISRGYNLLIKALFHTHFSDAQCGFKALTCHAARELLPLVEDNSWFMDTELLILAERLGYSIFDMPVTWTEDSDSRVKIYRTAWEDICGLIRLRRRLKCAGATLAVVQRASRAQG